MLNKVIIKNYQSHKLTKLNLHSGVNCIVGSSDVGKTAIVRSLRWIGWNRPIGDTFRSSWGGETCVTLEVDNHLVQRVKGPGGNVYLLDDLNLSAIKTEVPAEVMEVLNINTINLQRQFDRPFLLDSTPGEIAQHFNAIAKLDAIDNSNRNVQTWIRGLQQSIETDELRIPDLEDQLKQFDNLDAWDAKVSKIEKMLQEKNDTNTNCTLLKDKILRIEGINNKLGEYQKLLSLEKNVDKILIIIGSRKTAAEEVSTFNKFISKIEDLECKAAEYQTTISLEKSVLRSIALFEKKRAELENLSVFSKFISKIENVTSEALIANNNLHDLQVKFNKEFPNSCPLCGQPKPKHLCELKNQ